MLERLAQHLSTTVWLRSEKKARVEVVGAKTDEGKAYIEAGMVGLREGSAVIGGQENFKVGGRSKIDKVKASKNARMAGLKEGSAVVRERENSKVGAQWLDGGLSCLLRDF